MISLKQAFLIAFSLSCVALTLNGDEPVCHRCEEIREYNAKYHENFEYYDEYLKNHGDKGQKTTEALSEQPHKEITSAAKLPEPSTQNKSGSPKSL